MKIDILNLEGPAKHLINLIEKVFGVYIEPHQMRRIARAKVEVAKIKAQGEIEVQDIKRRALNRWVTEQTKYQQNIEAITIEALPKLKEEAKPDSIEEDWIINFFDKGRKISDCEMRDLWARILSGESNSPGSFSKRTVNCVAEFEKSDIELFERLCRFAWNVPIPTPLIFNNLEWVYIGNGLDFDGLAHLESIGLIRFRPYGQGMLRTGLFSPCVVTYHSRRLTLILPQGIVNIGQVQFTRAGQELYPLVKWEPVSGFWEYVQGQWRDCLPNNSTAQTRPPGL